jgi:hypothetical protein
MSVISLFYGIFIRMYANEGHHMVPHFHVRKGDENASVAFDGTILAGRLSRTTHRQVQQWAALHQDELNANWDRARAGQALVKVDPLP